MIPPFRRIAIFDPQIVLGFPLPIPEQSRGHIFRWVSTAQRRGADALYFRIHGSEPASIQQWLEVLLAHPALPKLTLLLPAGFTAPDLSFAQHFPENATFPVSLSHHALWKGRSCHDHSGIQAAVDAGMDYAFLSPVFSTETHPQAPALGIETLAEICLQHPQFPIFALGGITPEREKQCIAAGAFGIAAIRYFS